mgnify:CR=1 FL=1
MSDIENSLELDVIAGYANELVDQLQPSNCLKIEMSECQNFSKVGKPFQSADGGDWESKIALNDTSEIKRPERSG